MLGEGLCLSICLCRSLWGKRGAVSREGMGHQGHFAPEGRCSQSTSEKESAVGSQMMSRSSRQRRDRQ